jgi:CHAT domain-containing protein/tetratricopeptide (TPR) repeat protein
MDCFNLVTVTLLFSLTPTIQLDGTLLAIASRCLEGAIADALVFAQTPQNRKDEAERLYDLGTQQLNQGQYREALQSLEQALGIYRAIGERQGEGLALNNIGRVYSNLGQYPQALKYYEQALAIKKQVGDKVGEGITLSNIGIIYSNRGQYARALKYHEQALLILKQEGNKSGQGITLNNIGTVYNKLGEYTQALKYFEQALTIRRDLGDKVGEGAILSNIGIVYDNLGQYPQALKYHEQALAIAKQIGDKAGEGKTFNNMGQVYYNLGQYPQALKYYEQALNIAKQVGNKVGEGIAFNNMGQLYDTVGQYAQALKYYEQALTIKKQVGDREGEGITLNNIGVVSRNLGQYRQALKYYEQALVIRREIGDKMGEGVTLNNIGGVYDNLGQEAEALKYYQQSLAIKKQVGDKAGEGITLSNIGTIYVNRGQYTEALNYFNQSLVISREIDDKTGEGITLDNIGNAYASLDRHAEALKYYQQALVIFKQVGNRSSEGIALNNIGAAYNSLGQYGDAEKHLLNAVEILESLRPGLTDANKVSIFETQAHTYRFLQQALVAQNKINDALEIAERGRARAFVELMAQQQATNPNNSQIIKPLTIQQIQQIARDQNATLVEYSIVNDAFKNQGKEEWRPSELYIWVVKPTGEVAFKQVDLKSLKIPLADLIITSRDSIGVRGRGLGAVGRVDTDNQTERLQQLHKLLIEPIAQFLPTNPTDRVIFIPQESLFLVPFAALQDENKKYSIEKHTILTAPAIQVLELTRKQRTTRILNADSRMKNGADALIVGNPTMPLISSQIGQPPQQLSSLPGAEQEAHAIAQLFNTKALTGNQATKFTVKQQMEKARMIHLATHGLLDDFTGQGVPGAIALAPSGNDNGLLTSSEIFDMKLRAELVVLSACDTGRGTITGDGVIGLSRSLITAGVPSVIVSLWSVPDAPTASLMTEFYRQMQQNPDKATALRQAMLTTMKQHPNPKNWAAFTLIGEAE